MSIQEQIDDYVEYLVQCRDVKGLSDLTREDRAKLIFWILVDNNLWVKTIKTMHHAIRKEVEKSNKGGLK
jgi:hypothetical protein